MEEVAEFKAYQKESDKVLEAATKGLEKSKQQADRKKAEILQEMFKNYQRDDEAQMYYDKMKELCQLQAEKTSLVEISNVK